MTAFLSVESSLTGRLWRGPDAMLERAAEALAQDSRLPLPVSRVLAARGVPAHEAPLYLDPKLRDLLPDPSDLRDMDKAAERLVAAMLAGQRIAIFADYDVDGGASAALLLDWLRRQGRDATLYIPDRIDEGYGPNAPAIAALSRDHDLIVCVDCGTLSFDALAASTCDVIVLDHHQGGETLPPVLAVVNPNRADEDGSLGHLCAAGVVFLTLVRCNGLLRRGGHAQPDLIPLLDLVALATVADVAPLVGVNRAFVRQGLLIMARRERPGLVALSDVARLDSAPNAFHLGFLLGPRINAGGRVGRADLGALCLSCTDSRQAERLAAELDALNRDRRAIEAAVRDEALAQVEARASDGLVAWAAGEGWHPGVVGIVAARLKEATGLPAVVIGVDGGIGKGSARSVPGVDLGRAIQRLSAEGLLLKGGGHAMAAGLTVEEARIPAAMERLSQLLSREMAERPGAGELRISGLLDPAGATVELMQMLERAGPFGQAAPAPRFAFAEQLIDSAGAMGDSHLRLRFRSPGSPVLEAVAWGAMNGPLGPALLGARGRRFHLAGKLELTQWGGRERVRLRLDDAAPVG
ncbi:single-stranded-DNA-specific exonuclease RecJ [Paracoccus sp. P2]|uniref:Single-stranded-DNA-specific exonuclease RecJ n=1 Tax=Paracoccus pantotrophus TaxID=82367 RepID=A0A7H9BRG6_PARPN|nr:single-stranded-DNA-specific exonuclease RecJ [Paracoccus pantotrophus]MDF3852990.1 single-stranded-DNA-specific exonuclease RecJ [Paracoccus pantotrophus]QLH13924.1 single-stranded-DNA-specific exonuclease RecJ [Paracoccus pantotrophus]RDE01068.1 single-stranded-DNA-specific exonuclease RecJ [Paracoccus pantotrophus]RNI17457.1 single-stranded-DNA-specific exonuclease RecJ [Paracoccus pantotrophus]WGR66944.1 single-stranded-DNA-specific exonuclease RecJ [Paracoccus pantotrophus]